MTQTSDPKDNPVRPWKLISSSRALDEKWFPVRKDTVQLPSGKIVDDYFIWEGPHIVAVVAITPEGKFVLVRQYRHAVGKILYQFPAGAIDKNETPEAAARRELEEESGYVAKKLIHLCQVAPYATKITPVEDIFLAMDATPTGVQHYDEQEESEVVLLSKDELLKLLATEETVSSLVPTGLLFALRHLGDI